MSKLLRSIQVTGLAKLDADESYEAAFNEFFSSQPIDEAAFWKLIPTFRKYFYQFAVDRGRSEAAQDAAQELFRQAFDNTIPLDQAITFAATYRAIKDQIDNKIARHFEYNGDGYGDVIDILPLCGQKFFDSLDNLPGGLNDDTEAYIVQLAKIKLIEESTFFTDKLLQGRAQQFARLVGDEHYIGMALKQKAKEFALHFLDSTPE